MASIVSERVQLAKLCISRDWSKAIRLLDSLLSRSRVIQDICNRAFCYSQLELHKHVIKDCDWALQLDPSVLQAYILKGNAFSALGRKADAVLVWEQGYEHVVNQSADLKQLLELEQHLSFAKQEISMSHQNRVLGPSKSSVSIDESGPHINGKPEDNYDNHNKSNEKFLSCVESKDDALDMHSDLSNTIEGNRTSGNQLNGTHDIIDKLSYESESSNNSSETSETPGNLSIVHTNSSNLSDNRRKPMSTTDICKKISDVTKKNKKLCVTKISKTKSISVDFRLSRGIAQVNEGRYAHAISIFSQILKEEHMYPEALIGRGTAYAFQRELDSAIADFTKAIELNPSACEAYKRLGQARAALGEFAEAISDLTKALEFEPNAADILHERGIVNYKFKDFYGAVEDLSTCLKLDKSNQSAHTYLGLALSSIGEYKKAEEEHLKSIKIDESFLEAWAHLTQFYQDLADSAKALECTRKALKIDARFARAYHLRGSIFNGMGKHRLAIKDLSAALSIENSNIECLYLRGSCYHAIGEYGAAVKDYNVALELEMDSMEKFVLQCLAFFQKEIALYTASRINREFIWFDIDGDIAPLFKEYWCKRLHPKDVCEKVYRQPPLRESLKKGKIRKQEFSSTKQKADLLQAADFIGKKIQYDCPGFLPNRRQHRMAGLAAIEIAQKVSKAWRSARAERKHSNKSAQKYGKRTQRKERINMPSNNRGGSGCSTSSSYDISTSYCSIDDRSTSHSMSWKDVYSLAVRWRQISEPCDPVLWVNKLSEEFNSGFGSHTPMVLGQAKVIRYFPYCERTLNIAKIIMTDKKYVYSKADGIIDLSEDEKVQEILQANSWSDLYQVVGEDFWLATWCDSTAFEGKKLEGTRISLVRMGNRGFDFAIRTPCTPSRWNHFDEEMTTAWEALCNSYCGENFGSTDFNALENVRDAILRMTYYWYNFTPLSRGSASVGFIVLLGLFLAANMEYTGNIPQGLQVDWEAILDLDPKSFINSTKSWLYPSLDVTTSWKDYPDVSSTFTTTGSIVVALSNFYDSAP